MAIVDHPQRNGRGGFFSIDYRDAAGRRIRERVSVYTDAQSKRQAKKIAEAREAQRKGEAAQGIARPKAAGITLDRLCELFLAEHVARSTFAADMLKAPRAVLGARLASTITTADVEDFAKRRQAGRLDYIASRDPRPRAASAATVRKELETLGQVYRWAIPRDFGITTNPAKDAAKPPATKGRVAFVAREDWPRVEEAMPPFLRPLARFLAFSGLRLKEATTLTWGLVDWSARTIHTAPDNKTGTRAVPLNQTALDVLRELHEAQERRRREDARLAGIVPAREARIFHDHDGAVIDDKRRHRLSHVIAAAVQRLGYPGGAHLLRHTCASWLVQGGVPILTVSKVLGHASVAVTMRYAHLAPRNLHDAVGALDSWTGTGEWTPDGHAPKGGTVTLNESAT